MKHFDYGNFILKNEIVIAALSFLILLPWIFLQINTRIPGDAAFLYTGAEYFLSGFKMKDYYYDNNPPLCFLIYIPAVLLHYTGISSPYAVNLLTYGYITIAAVCILTLLNINKLFTATEKAIIFSGYICAVTLLCYTEFGQKDHLISISLLPFVLAQTTQSTDNKKISGLRLCNFIFWTPFILIKPHFLLIPFTVIGLRLFKAKNMKSIFQSDFYCLMIGACLYAGIILFYFPDYLFEILPEIGLLYAGNPVGLQTTKYAFAFLIITVFFLSLIGMSEKLPNKKDLLIFPLISIITILIFLIQNKGYSLHTLPIYPFFLISAFTAIKQITPAKHSSQPHFKYFIIFIIFLLGYALLGQREKILTHNEYANSSLAKLLNEKAGKQTFLFESSTTNIFYTQSLYGENKVGSRFSSLWILNYIQPLRETDNSALTEKIYSMLAEDLNKFKPAIIGLEFSPENNPLLSDSFRYHLKLNEEWQHYEEIGTTEINKKEFRDFFTKEKEKIIYKLFKRKRL